MEEFNEMWDKLKKVLFAKEKNALKDFLGYEIPEDYNNKLINQELENVCIQMPDEYLDKFYEKYVLN